MSTLQQSSNADLESATNCDNGGGGEQQLADAIEIVGENNNGGDGGNQKKERRQSSVSECSMEIVDLEAGAVETKLHLDKVEKDCRICHLSMDAANQDSGIPIELGCSCKDDLAAAHKQCAEAWFKIKGDKTCEICGSVAQNVVGVTEAEPAESWNETSDAAAAAATTSQPSSQSRNFWQGHRFLNFLLACMVFAFVISWLFHFNVPS
ncbi:RING/FYVE/PHD zinc finger superfamily protein [Perilla frutescens var. hirtella]|uniref:RING/FYVE/PHD zinc finger superfamily protein n=1 Tax=Perilla frutescens var. hirtella TaxID=608512 RepID=A0AAD4P529_PERFH|nr:RING/FYVE/PHD zinc finger superfamily protein [Perilla frutescens var. hirtella]